MLAVDHFGIADKFMTKPTKNGVESIYNLNKIESFLRAICKY